MNGGLHSFMGGGVADIANATEKTTAGRGPWQEVARHRTRRVHDFTTRSHKSIARLPDSQPGGVAGA